MDDMILNREFKNKRNNDNIDDIKLSYEPKDMIVEADRED